MCLEKVPGKCDIICLNTPKKRFLQLIQSHDKSKEYILKVERFALNVHLGSLNYQHQLASIGSISSCELVLLTIVLLSFISNLSRLVGLMSYNVLHLFYWHIILYWSPKSNMKCAYLNLNCHLAISMSKSSCIYLLTKKSQKFIPWVRPT